MKPKRTNALCSYWIVQTIPMWPGVALIGREGKCKPRYTEGGELCATHV
jgi:hypothetical protein